MYSWFGLNTALFHAINDVKQPWLDAFMLLGAAISARSLIVVYGPLFLIIAVIVSSRHMRAQRLTAAGLWFTAVLTLAGAYLAGEAFLLAIAGGYAYQSPSAALGPDSLKILGKLDFRTSFPGVHAFFAVTCVASVWLVLSPALRALALFFVVWVCVSMIYVGANFPADVCAGLLTALLIVLIVRKLVKPIVAGSVAWVAGRKARWARLD